jgi:hypothetical protein
VSGSQTDNGDPEAKIALRLHAFTWAPERPAVLDLFAGEGHMYREAWKPACGRYLGIEKRFRRPAGDPAGECWRGDNAQLLKRAMAAGPWDVIDLDAYANPWILLRQVLRLQPARDLVVTATEGLARSLHVNNSDFAFAIAGVGKLATSMFQTGAPFFRWHDDIVRWALAWSETGARVKAVECKRSHPRRDIVGPGDHATYYAIRYRA